MFLCDERTLGKLAQKCLKDHLLAKEDNDLLPGKQFENTFAIQLEDRISIKLRHVMRA